VIVGNGARPACGVLENGRITLSGRSADILGAKGVVERYLGIGQAVGDGASVRQRAMSERLGQILRA
jgi:hypothetical protein